MDEGKCEVNDKFLCHSCQEVAGGCDVTSYPLPHLSRCGGAGVGSDFTPVEVTSICKRNWDEQEDDCPTDVRDYNVGASDYATHKIQPWDIWKEYSLNPWDADIVKRVLRDKEGDSRELDYEKIKHICDERIRQIKEDKGE